MPQPNGYRKALRFMRHADKFGFPIITFVDTPGAYAGKNAEELGQVHHSANQPFSVSQIRTFAPLQPSGSDSDTFSLGKQTLHLCQTASAM